jgi:hypothetical protein
MLEFESRSDIWRVNAMFYCRTCYVRVVSLISDSCMQCSLSIMSVPWVTPDGVYFLDFMSYMYSLYAVCIMKAGKALNGFECMCL